MLPILRPGASTPPPAKFRHSHAVSQFQPHSTPCPLQSKNLGAWSADIGTGQNICLEQAQTLIEDCTRWRSPAASHVQHMSPLKHQLVSQEACPAGHSSALGAHQYRRDNSQLDAEWGTSTSLSHHQPQDCTIAGYADRSDFWRPLVSSAPHSARRPQSPSTYHDDQTGESPLHSARHSHSGARFVTNTVGMGVCSSAVSASSSPRVDVNAPANHVPLRAALQQLRGMTDSLVASRRAPSRNEAPDHNTAGDAHTTQESAQRFHSRDRTAPVTNKKTHSSDDKYLRILKNLQAKGAAGGGLAAQLLEGASASSKLPLPQKNVRCASSDSSSSDGLQRLSRRGRKPSTSP